MSVAVEVPEVVVEPPPATKRSGETLAGGWDYGCAIVSGEVYCWGNAYYGLHTEFNDDILSTMILTWEGCFNARDLGGLPCATGTTATRAVMRADSLDGLTPRAWDQVLAYGVRTVIDLRNDDERTTGDRPSDIDTVHLPVDNIDDREFWDAWTSGPQFGTPLFYLPHIERFPDRTARVISAIAHAPPGGVVFHCSVGRDRTGLITMLLLSLLGASTDTITDDYALSDAGVRARYEHQGKPDPTPQIEAFMTTRNTTVRATLIDALERLDGPTWMRDGGLGAADVAALRDRLCT